MGVPKRLFMLDEEILSAIWTDVLATSLEIFVALLLTAVESCSCLFSFFYKHLWKEPDRREVPAIQNTLLNSDFDKCADMHYLMNL